MTKRGHHGVRSSGSVWFAFCSHSAPLTPVLGTPSPRGRHDSRGQRSSRASGPALREQKGFSGRVFLGASTTAFPVGVFTAETGGEVAQEVQINSPGTSSLRGTKGQERRCDGEVLPPPAFQRHRMFSNTEIIFLVFQEIDQTENSFSIRNENR